MVRMLCCCICLILIGQFAASRCIAQAAPKEGSAGSLKLTVRIMGLRNTKGQLHIALYGSEKRGKGFPGSDKDALKVQMVPASDCIPEHDEAVPSGKRPRIRYATSVVFSDLAPGVYAVAMYHDENANGKMDFQWYGPPREGAGASNNPRPRMRAPNFKESSFELNAETAIEIQVKYP